ncbi:membrane protein insertion efficiency factor YidD [Curtobacterium luteum]|uniref:membrane protein insertion efficiency factor YidD n=1 Tax=Curtobacterium luteum TaxID=33881 RepID=UPI00380F26CA
MNRSPLARVAWVLALLPRNACVVVLRAYRAVISPLYGNVCRYHPSCSRYALEAIQQYGVVRGSAMGAWRIARCNPWAAGGIDDVPERRRSYTVNRFGFVTGPADDPTPTPQTQQPAIAPLLLAQRTRKA